MAGYPWIYWLVVLIVVGAVVMVLIGIGYLIGRRVAHREAMAGLREIQESADRLHRLVTGEPSCRVVR